MRNTPNITVNIEGGQIVARNGCGIILRIIQIDAIEAVGYMTTEADPILCDYYYLINANSCTFIFPIVEINGVLATIHHLEVTLPGYDTRSSMANSTHLGTTTVWPNSMAGRPFPFHTRVCESYLVSCSHSIWISKMALLASRIKALIALFVLALMAIMVLLCLPKKGKRSGEERYAALAPVPRDSVQTSGKCPAPTESQADLSLPFSESLPSHPSIPAVPAEAASALAERPSPDASEVDRRQAASDKNQRMDELLDLPSIPADYVATMVALFRDGTQDIPTRAFAVQHIGLYAQALHRSGTYDAGSGDARLCRTALLDAAGETGTIVAAAAFRALSDLAGFDSHIEACRLDEMLVSCAGDDAASTAARVMAAQLCGERAIASSRASLGHILDDPSAPVPLRKAAQWSLSRLEKDSP